MMKSQTTSSVTTVKSKDEAFKLMAIYNPDEQNRFASYPDRCVNGNSPTLSNVSRDYGKQVSSDWLVLELNDYQNFVGVKEDRKAPLEVIRSTASMVYQKYHFLKLSELMLFFHKLKMGDYGEMYGCVDATRILRALRSFMDDRCSLILRAEQEQRDMERAINKQKAISFEEYKCRNNLSRK